MAKAQDSSKRKMRAVVLAAGLGKRLRSGTAKVLHPVLGQPMIWRILHALNQLNQSIQTVSTDLPPGQIVLEGIHVIVGHNADQVEKSIEQYRQEYKPSLTISTHTQRPQLGTGHALMTLDALDGFPGDVMVVPGDCPLLSKEILTSLIDAHINKKAHLSLLSTELDDPAGYGRILRSASKQILAIVEDKDASEKERRIQEINASVY
jgi:bifunctional N-acetylglucosamine-1-phosphate-uridyltransferase/glucosamine-1-phosphate-acetyltransferase GlmU-like protein